MTEKPNLLSGTNDVDDKSFLKRQSNLFHRRD